MTWSGAARTLPVLCLALFASCTATPQADPPSNAQRSIPEPVPDARLALETFDSAWARIARSHYDSTFRGVDWSAVRRELRPRAARAAGEEELREVLREMLGRLRESHYGLIPRAVADAVDPAANLPANGRPGDAGMSLRVADGRVVVYAVERGGPAERAGIRAGWVVEAIDGRSVDDALRALSELTIPNERRAALARFLWRLDGELSGAALTPLELIGRDGADHLHTMRIVRAEQRGEPVRFGNLPAFFARASHQRVHRGASCAGMIRFNVWMIPALRAFDAAVDSLRDCAGMVVDLRGNPGGVAGMLMGAAGHFLDRPVPLGVMRSRSGELRFTANPRRVDGSGQPVEPFAGPLAVLVDVMTASTSEFFAGGLQALGRARIFGEVTAGQALPAVASRLPNGDVLMYVVADFTGPNGARFEGAGVLPDVTVPLRREDLLAGRDAALEAALAWIFGHG